MGSYVILKMARQFLDQEWPKVERFLADGLEHGEGELDINQLRLLCSQGHVDLFVINDGDRLAGCFAIEAIQYPNYRVAHVISAGGKMICNATFWVGLRDWLKSLGYSKVQCYCRPSVARMICRIDGFRTSYHIVRCEL